MNRFFVPSDFTDKEVCIDGAEAHHILTVRRLKLGDSIDLFNGSGTECVGTISGIAGGDRQRKRSVRVKIVKVQDVSREVGVDITVAFSAPKGKRADLIVEKCSELGVKRLIPLITERSVIRENVVGKVEKWRRIAVESAKQCGRNIIAGVSDFVSFESMRQSVNLYDMAILLTRCCDNGQGLKALLKSNAEVRSALCVIGSEGGFSRVEIEAAGNAGFHVAEIVPQTLRVETAAIAVVSMLVYEYS